MSYWGFPRYVSVGEKKQKARKKLEQLRKKNKNIEPVIIEGRTLAHTWWGKAWNKNLEEYADYSNRIGRGRSYVRCGSVLDLQISGGEVKSLVQGSESKPYSVVIKIKALEKSIWKKIKDVCEGKLDSLQELLVGKFPKALDEIFTAHGKGLFPAPKEIDFDCNCPDWADMCKHVAATLYGIGARLDKDPNLFFALRKIEINDLITETVKGKTKELLAKAKKKSGRIIEDQDLSSVFGIELDSASLPPKEVKVKATRKDKTPKTKKTTSKQPEIKQTKSVSKSGTKKASTKTIKKATKDAAKVKVTKKPAKKTKVKTPVKAVKKVSKKKGTRKL
ncbi:MAG: hypothetical protein H8D23_10590 [Candidatus Brocadiales bacterium]|nr:hypothetical protein [Candidatus Brocadiales bacterium]